MMMMMMMMKMMMMMMMMMASSIHELRAVISMVDYLMHRVLIIIMYVGSFKEDDLL